MLKSDKVGLFIKNVFYQKGVFPFFMFTDNKISKSDRGHFFEKKSDFSKKNPIFCEVNFNYANVKCYKGKR